MDSNVNQQDQSAQRPVENIDECQCVGESIETEMSNDVETQPSKAVSMELDRSQESEMEQQAQSDAPVILDPDTGCLISKVDQPCHSQTAESVESCVSLTENYGSEIVSSVQTSMENQSKVNIRPEQMPNYLEGLDTGTGVPSFLARNSDETDLATNKSVEGLSEDLKSAGYDKTGQNKDSEVIELVVKQRPDLCQKMYELVSKLDIAESFDNMTMDYKQNEDATNIKVSPLNDGNLDASICANGTVANTVMETASNKEGPEEIVITIADDLDVPFDETAQNIALSCFNLTGNESNIFSNTSEMLINNDVNLQNALRERDLLLTGADTSYLLSTPKLGSINKTEDCTALVSPTFDVKANEALNWLPRQSYSGCGVPGYGPKKGGRFEGDVDCWSNCTSGLDQCVPHQVFLDPGEVESDLEELPVHPVLLDERGDYDSEPIAYQTYSDKEGNIYCYNPKNGRFELEAIHEVVECKSSFREAVVGSSRDVQEKEKKHGCASSESLAENDNRHDDNKNVENSQKKARDNVEPVVENEFMIQLPDDVDKRAAMVMDMANGKFGTCPHVVKVLDNGSVVEITKWFKKFLPKPKKRIKKEQKTKDNGLGSM